MSRFRSEILCLVACLFMAFPASALEPDKAVTQYVIDYWRSEDGLPSNFIRSITETQDGYLWLATQGGAVKFDGLDFEVFDQTNTPEIVSDDIRDVFPASNGDVWIATYGGGAVRLRDGTFTHFSAEDGLGNNIVRCIFEDSSGALWFCTAAGLSRLEDGAFTNFTTEDGLLNDLVFTAAQGPEGDLWIGVLGGFSRLSEGEFTNYREGEELPAGASFVTAISPDPDGGVWLGSYGGGLLYARDGEFRQLTEEDGLADNRLLRLARDGDGNLWIATYDEGLQRYRDGRFEVLDNSTGLQSNLVFGLYEDRRGSIWVGTMGDGLRRIKDGPFITFGAREGLSDSKVFAVLGEPEGPVWIGTEGGGLNRYQDGHITTLDTDDGLSSNNVISLARGPGGDLWIGTFGGGINLLRQGEFRAISTSDGLPSNQVFALEPDGDGGLWLGTFRGLARFRDGEISSYTMEDGLGGIDVRAVATGPAGDLWIGTNGGGLTRYDGESFETFSENEGLAGNLVYALYPGSGGALWIGTKGGGLSRLEAGRLDSFTTRQGLWDDSIYGIIEDDQGHLWLSCPKGVFRVAKSQFDAVASGRQAQLEITRYDRSDGLRGGHTVGGSQPAAWKASDGKLWFATFNGAAVLDPGAIEQPAYSPDVYLKEMVVEGGARADIAQAVLPPGVNQIELHYGAIDLTNPNDVRFRYRLVGPDENWVDAGTRRVAYYTHMPPGEYRFEVQAASGKGPWSAPVNASFSVEPRFYQTIWFAVLAALGLVGLGSALYALRVRGLRRRERELSTLVGLRTKELEEAKERFEQLSKTDALTGLPNRRYLEERLTGEWDRAVRSGWEISVIMLDIDHFKQFNDTYGHHAGDKCLKRVGHVLEKVLTRTSDVVARYGGEEFLVLLPETSAEEASIVAERIRLKVSEMELSGSDKERMLRVTVSAGVSADGPERGDNPQRLIDAADRALYRAKETGRDRVVVERDTEN